MISLGRGGLTLIEARPAAGASIRSATGSRTKPSHIVPSVCALVHIRIWWDQLLSKIVRRDTSEMAARRDKAAEARAAIQQFAAAAERRRFCADRATSVAATRPTPAAYSITPATMSRPSTFRADRVLCPIMVPNEDGRDVETILVGREGAVGGIVSEGYLPAYTRIMVKFGGPFVRLHVGKLKRRKQSRPRCATFSRAMPTACSPRSSSRRPATRSIRSSSAPRNGSSRRWSAPTATMSCR